MATPATVRQTWPIETAQRFEFLVMDDELDVPLTSGTVAFEIVTATGGAVSNGTATGSHLGAGVWAFSVQALTLTEDALYRCKLTVTKTGLTKRTHRWWVRAVWEEPVLVAA